MIEDDLLAAMGEQRGIGAADRLCDACFWVSMRPRYL